MTTCALVANPRLHHRPGGLPHCKELSMLRSMCPLREVIGCSERVREHRLARKWLSSMTHRISACAYIDTQKRGARFECKSHWRQGVHRAAVRRATVTSPRQSTLLAGSQDAYRASIAQQRIPIPSQCLLGCPGAAPFQLFLTARVFRQRLQLEQSACSLRADSAM